jgi:HK97 family phage prohead protease
VPYFITDTAEGCAGWATIKDDGEVIGCHETKQAAIDQMVAVSIAEGLEPGGERNLEGPAAIVIEIDGVLVDADGMPRDNVIRFVDEYEGEVIIITARVESERDATIAELERIDADWDQLRMRPADIDAMVFKSDDMKDILDVYNVEIAIEDDEDIRAEYARIGITTLTPDSVDPQELPEMLERQVDLTLPQYIRDAAARGLELRAEGYGGDGLVDRTIREARLMADGEVSEDKVVRVAAWAARHLVDLDAPQNSDADADGWPGNGAVAFYLWGIDPLDPEPAISWFEGKAEQIREEEAEDNERMYPGLSVRERPGATLFHMENGVETRRITVNEFEIRDGEGTDGMTFRGLAAPFNSTSEPLPFIETIKPGAFTRSLKSRNEIKMFVNHDTSRVLASKRAGTLRLWESERGLEVEADLPDTTDGRDMAYLIRRGDIDSMSFGFSVPRGGDSWSDDGQQRELREVRLHEVSVVSFPANRDTVSTVRSLDGLVDATGLEAEKLNAAITALEKGETLDDDLASVLDAAVTKLRAERDDVQAALALKQKQLDVLLARV